MDFVFHGSGEVPDPTRPEQWAPWRPKLPPDAAHNNETGCWLMQERLRREEEQECDFLLEYFHFTRDEICDRIYWSWEENQLRNAFHQVWKATPFPKENTPEAGLGPSAPHSPYPGRDAAAESAAAVDEGIFEAAKQASLQIRAKGAPKVDSWL